MMISLVFYRKIIVMHRLVLGSFLCLSLLAISACSSSFERTSRRSGETIILPDPEAAKGELGPDVIDLTVRSSDLGADYIDAPLGKASKAAATVQDDYEGYVSQYETAAPSTATPVYAPAQNSGGYSSYQINKNVEVFALD